jgi:hypothetical protein
MNIINFCPIAVVLIFGAQAMGADSKTKTPVKVADNLIGRAPYRYNGVVRTDDGRGSGFCAWNKRAFFSAAHVVFDAEDGEWKEPPIWYPRTHAIQLAPGNAIPSRGYFRWTSYREFAYEEETIDQDQAFGRDIIVGFAFKDLISGNPAKLNLNGYTDLRSPIQSLMTGYPARNAYTGKKIGGYFMHQTGPSFRVYQPLAGSAIETTLISSGPGNSGGPIWTQKGTKSWAASGIVVGGLPSESVIYAFSNETSTLLRAVEPVVDLDGPQSTNVSTVSSSSRFFSDLRARQLPDGVHQWTDVPLNVSGFGTDATVKSVRLAIKVKTTHRGDLQVLLSGPGGYQTIVHNEQGAGATDLVINYRDFSEEFLDIPVDGRWTVRFQDRLKGDIATVQSVVLEIEAEAAAASTGGTDP